MQATKSLVEEYKELGLNVTTEYTDEAGVDTVCVLSGGHACRSGKSNGGGKADLRFE